MSLFVFVALVGWGSAIGGILFAWLAYRRRKTPKRAMIMGTVSLVLIGTAISVFMSVQEAYRARNFSIACADLRGVGTALHIYYREYDQFPTNLREMTTGFAVSPRSLKSVFKRHTETSECDYIYVAGLSKDDPDDWLHVFDLPDIHEDGTRSVLFLSGIVKTFSKGEFDSLFAAFEKAYIAKYGEKPNYVSER